jgi:hypothetical protein
MCPLRRFFMEASSYMARAFPALAGHVMISFLSSPGFRCLFRKRGYEAIESVRFLIRANLPGSFLKPLGLALVLNLRFSFLLLARFAHGDFQL